jgi:hypothetical protein
MAQLIIYGTSDDLIEVEGAIDEEFPAPQQGDETGGYVAISDGTLLSITYTNVGFWKISVISLGGQTALIMAKATDLDNDYSDKVILNGDFSWVLMGTDLVRKGNE